MNVPSDLRFTDSHEWVRIEPDGVATVGISDHAQSELGDIVYLDLPAIGRQCTAGESVAVIESVKAASDIYAPLAGEIVEVNTAAAAETSLVNREPYDGGWLFKVKMAAPGSESALMDAAVYQGKIGG